MTTTPDVQPVVEPADHVPGPPQGRWDYEHYAQIPDDGHRYEVIDGVLYMAPAPGAAHQKAVLRIASHLMTHIEDAGLGDVLMAPFDVELHAGGRTVVQPDVLVILKVHGSVLTPSRAVGTPDLVVEVASPSTASYDRRAKTDAYARAGVPEYWIVDPYAHTVELMRLEEGGYRSAGVFQGQAILPSKVIPTMPVPVEQFFAS